MGVTRFSIETLINPYLKGVAKVVDLGAQNNYSQGRLPAPYMRKWWEEKRVEYVSVDLSGECGALRRDLTKRLPDMEEFDLVMDFGTSEHVGTSIKDYYQCWLNKWSLCKIGGLIISENPMTGNWPGHGVHYLGKEFYKHIKGDFRLIATGTTRLWGITLTDGMCGVLFRRRASTSYPLKNLIRTLFTKNKTSCI